MYTIKNKNILYLLYYIILRKISRYLLPTMVEIYLVFQPWYLPIMIPDIILKTKGIKQIPSFKSEKILNKFNLYLFKKNHV